MTVERFQLISDFKPSGDQSKAIQGLVKAYQEGKKELCLLGVTGSGKTFTVASFLEKINKPALVLTHNKTLAAQLYREFRDFFPNNAVEYFVSYYNYYQPEAYVPTSDTFIEKDSSVNDEIDRLRLRATSSLLERKDVLIVASISCIYGLGSPEEYRQSLVFLEKGVEVDRNQVMRQLLHIQYQRNDLEIARGNFRVRGDVVEIYPAYRQEGVRIDWFGDEIEDISLIDPITGRVIRKLDQSIIYPARHFITSPIRLKSALVNIKDELRERIQYFQEKKKAIETERIQLRTQYDIEMLEEMGYCNGIENYSRHLTGRKIGEAPACLLDYFEDEFVTIIDESHVSLPQVRGMYEGDRSRKMTLVDYGFRLPSALDNRPLNFLEFQKKAKRILYVSATPRDYEKKRSELIVEQIIRPTGLLDPEIEVLPTQNQIENLLKQIQKRIQVQERVFVTTLTKKMAEDLSDYLREEGIKVAYLHSEIQTIERVEIIRELRQGIYDVLVGVNLLREGLDIPEVSLVAILDADKEGFLRNAHSLIQTIGRAARNINGHAIFYADKITDSMKVCIEETNRRRKIQSEYNKKHNINPKSIRKEISVIIERDFAKQKEEEALKEINRDLNLDKLKSTTEKIEFLEKEMLKSAEELNFEKATLLRDKIEILKNSYTKTFSKKARAKNK